MDVSRRMMFARAGLLTTALAASGGQACTLVASLKPIDFSDAACRRSLRELVNLINRAPALSDPDLEARVEKLAIRFDEEVSDPILNYPKTAPAEDAGLIRAWSMTGRKRDRSPLAIRHLNLLKGERGVALYQFTLRRDQYFPEVTAEEVDGGSCDAPSDAHYAPVDSSYLGFFRNNKLREVTAFDVWLRTS